MLLPTVVAAQTAPAPASASASAQASDPAPDAALGAARLAWLSQPDVQAQLAAGKVVADSHLDEAHGQASLDAAVRVHAPPSVIWPLIVECKYAATLIPGLRHCKTLQSAPDGSWAVVEHDIRYSPLLPTVHSVFRADYQPPLRMDFHRVAGNLKNEVGSWILTPSADGLETTVEYHIAIEPGFWVPRSFVRHSLHKQLPAALLAVREHAEADVASKHSSSPSLARAAGAAAIDAPASSGTIGSSVDQPPH